MPAIDLTAVAGIDVEVSVDDRARTTMSWAIVFRANQYLKNSLWVLPFVGAMVGLVLAEIGLRLDAGVPVRGQHASGNGDGRPLGHDRCDGIADSTGRPSTRSSAASTPPLLCGSRAASTWTWHETRTPRASAVRPGREKGNGMQRRADA